ncbi:MAG: hypothetical protein Kilf2KO_31370 [Rhodospirillales bacterium]
MFIQPSDGYRFPDSLMHPPVMAIGDSMYNGMRSATINREFAAKSVPALVARALAPDYEFRTPLYPEVLLLDLEQTLRELDLGDLVSRLRNRLRAAMDNARRWADDAHVLPQEHAAWDNLSLSGAVIEDVTERSFAYWDQRIALLRPLLDQIQALDDLGTSGIDIMELHMGLNARFLNNPNRRAELNELRPIDLVAARQPKMLLINLGSNHGIIDITLGGSEAPNRRDPDTGLRSLAAWAEDMAGLAELLVDLPPQTERIVVNTLVLPSSVPNLMYPYNPREIYPGELTKSQGYYPVYDNRLGGSGDYTQYSAAEMRAIDREVSAINQRMMARMKAVFVARGDERLRFFRLDQRLKAYDAKHDDKKGVRRTTPGARLEFPRRRYGNEAIDFDNFLLFDFLDGFRQGGIASLDNHHPSGLGYSILARELLKTLKSEDPSINLNHLMISEIGDRLFSDPPAEYASIIRIWYRLRRRRAGYRREPNLAEARGEELPSETPSLDMTQEEQDVAGYVDVMEQMLRKGR